MRPLAVLVVAVLASAVALSTPRPAARAAPLSVLDLGDSLSVGTAPYLRVRLRGYRVERHHDVGLHAYDAAAIVARAGAALPPILVVSAGSNDDPRIVATFIRAVSKLLSAAGRGRCVVWPNIVRPPAVGASYEGLNRALARAASRHRNLMLVDWVGLVRAHPRWLSGDGVHVSAAGYRARAAAIATAVRTRCPRVVA